MKKFMGFLGVLAASLAASPAFAVTGTELTAALGDGATLLGSVEGSMLAVGTVIVGLAVIGAGIKWVKGTIFA
jgi:hypothetical protein